MKNIKAIIFDVDGTLLDTREFIFLSFNHALTSLGYPAPTRDQIRTIVGPPLEECYSKLANPTDIPELCQKHREFQVDNYDIIKPYPKQFETLQTLRTNLNLKTAVWSTRKMTVVESLKRHGIESLFDCIVTGDDVDKAKPDPEGIIKITNELKIEVANCVFVGDTIIDMQAGENAGVALTVGITHGFGESDELKKAGANIVIDSLDELLKLFP